MIEPEVLSTIRRFDRDLPLDCARTPPSCWYTDRAVFSLERARVFATAWTPVVRTATLTGSGDFSTSRVAGEPVVVVRDGRAGLRALSNVCRHHAAEIARGRGRNARFRCPYHGWSYGLDGRLASAPGLGGAATADIALPSYAVDVAGPYVWVNLAAAPEPLARSLGLAAETLSAGGAANAVFVAERRYTIACNWKVVVENYLDGGYHVAAVHGELAGQLALDGYTTTFDRLSAKQCVAASAVAGPRIGDGAEYAWAFPATMINRYGAIVDVNRVVPIAPDRTEIVYDYFFEADVAKDKGFVAESLDQSHRVQVEDTAICESVQRGLASRDFETGVYAPPREAAMHAFHRALATRLDPR